MHLKWIWILLQVLQLGITEKIQQKKPLKTSQNIRKIVANKCCL